MKDGKKIGDMVGSAISEFMEDMSSLEAERVARGEASGPLATLYASPAVGTRAIERYVEFERAFSKLSVDVLGPLTAQRHAYVAGGEGSLAKETFKEQREKEYAAWAGAGLDQADRDIQMLRQLGVDVTLEDAQQIVGLWAARLDGEGDAGGVAGPADDGEAQDAGEGEGEAQDAGDGPEAGAAEQAE